MSEEILKALMELFALIVKQDGGMLQSEHEYVSVFLDKQLTKETVNEYLALFDKHSGQIFEGIAIKVPEAPSVKDSVKILGICKKINRTLNQEQKIVVLVRLYELVNAHRHFTPQRMNIINTVAEVFRISSEEVEAAAQFVMNDNPDKLKNPSILVLNPEDEECDLCRRMRSGYQNTRIFILRVASVDLYFIRYVSSGQLYLNGLPRTGRNQSPGHLLGHAGCNQFANEDRISDLAGRRPLFGRYGSIRLFDSIRSNNTTGCHRSLQVDWRFGRG